jgi:hypothetical protein
MTESAPVPESIPPTATSNYTWATGLTFAAVVIILIFVLVAMAQLPPTAARAPFLLAALPHSLLFILLARNRHPSPATWGWARGIARATQWILVASGLVAVLAVVFFVLAAIIPPMILLLALSAVIGRILLDSGPAGIALLCALLVTQFVVERNAWQERAGMPEVAANTFMFQSSLSFWGLVLVAIFGGLRGASFVRSAEVKATAAEGGVRDRRTAVSQLVSIQKCAQTIARSADGQGYPRTLAAMGPRGAGCVDSAIARGVSYGSVISYFLRPIDSRGPVDHYWVMSSDTSGRAGTPAYLGDETGQVFESGYDSAWKLTGPDSVTPLLLLRSPVQRLRHIAKCIASTYESPSHEFPVDLSQIEPRKPPARCIASPDRNTGDFEVDISGANGTASFTVKYSAGAENSRKGHPTTFWLRAAPMIYGEGSIRSFLVDADGVIHFTTERRDATTSDPRVFGCEARDEIQPCLLKLVESSRPAHRRMGSTPRKRQVR